MATNPDDPVADYNLGVIYQSAGDRRDALRHYSQALRVNPRYVPALFNQATWSPCTSRPWRCSTTAR